MGCIILSRVRRPSSWEHQKGPIQQESEAETQARRQSVVRCVNALREPNNPQGFTDSIVKLFERFGITPARDPETAGWNERGWKRLYGVFQTMRENGAVARGVYPPVDIEIKGEGGAYANLYVDFQRIGPVEFAIVSPGACSLPGSSREDRPFQPTPNFYDQFEKAIGIDPLTRRPGQSNRVFVVTGDRYAVLPTPIKAPLLGEILKRIS